MNKHLHFIEPKPKKRKKPRKRKRKRVIAKKGEEVLQFHDVTETPKNGSVAKLYKAGMITLTNEDQVLQAENLFVIQRQTIEEVAKQLELPVELIQRWHSLFTWAAKRRDREQQIYARIGGRMETIASTIGVRTDEVATNLEGSLESAIRDKQESGEQFSPRDLKTLTSALKEIYELRRTIHGVEGKIDVRRVEHTVAPDSLAQMLATLKDDRPRISVENVEDAEFEPLEEAS